MHIPINHLRKLFAKWLSLLLQIGGPLIITKRVRFITNQDSYYKSCTTTLTLRKTPRVL